MIDFNNPTRQAGIRKMIQYEISKSLKYSFMQININVQRLAEVFRYLGGYTRFAGITFAELGNTLNQILLIAKIERRIRIFNFINRGILKLWIGG